MIALAMRFPRTVFSILLILVICVTDMKMTGIADEKSYPRVFPGQLLPIEKELQAVNAWYLSNARVKRSNRQMVFLFDSFGWFLYVTFCDPGPIGGRDVASLLIEPVSKETQSNFRLLSQDCIKLPEFGKACMRLYQNLHLFQRSVPIGIAGNPHNVSALTKHERKTLLSIAAHMEAVSRDPKASALTKSAAYLAAALTGGHDSNVDGVSLSALRQIPILYPNQKQISFISQYYLCFALIRRGEDEKAFLVVRTAIKGFQYVVYIHNLEAYKHLKSISKQSIFMHGK